jgi:hypothetical protein
MQLLNELTKGGLDFNYFIVFVNPPSMLRMCCLDVRSLIIRIHYWQRAISCPYLIIIISLDSWVLMGTMRIMSGFVNYNL